MTSVSREEVIDFYRITKTNLEDYTIKDFYGVLSLGVYAYLPMDITLALFSCIEEYKFRVQMYSKYNYVTKPTWSYLHKNYTTSTNSYYQYDFDSTVAFNLIEDREIQQFLNHYIDCQLDRSFNEVIHTKVKTVTGSWYSRTTPQQRYAYLFSKVSKVSYWYLGKRKTDSILNRLTKEFTKKTVELKNSGTPILINELTTEDREEAYEKYRLMRDKTRLNKRLGLPQPNITNQKN